ncbi:flagellar protein FlaG [Acetivibrio straminisolvens]|uniref:Flagellin n=1 Tax=Acetivibrio straminisolvens JCM 21531 TaxID=1294263 RepID=W4V4Y0_9FIRM|nr:flagellar protein FlaG [Acetivibrio straminisolvens]GAE87814.1 flagellin [Acetivibrio straminisolvens JCM 21531]
MKIDSMDAAKLQVFKTQNKDYQPNTINPGKEASNGRKVGSDAYLQENEKSEKLSQKTIMNAIEKANKAINGIHTQLEFSVHEKSKEIMVKVIDSETKEVIREIPPEKILDMVAAMLEMAGIIVDERG